MSLIVIAEFKEGQLMKIGCHLSVSKGLYKAGEKALDLGANAFQVFTKNPRSLRPKKLDMVDATKGKKFCEDNNISILCHTPYISNLSSPKDDLQKLSVDSLVEDLYIAEAYGSIGAVVHCGKHVGEGVEYGINRMVESLNLILDRYDGSTLLVLENAAGMGTEIGMDPQQLVQIRQMTKYPERIGFCFDTCHAFVAGIWNNELFDQLIESFKKTGFLENLVAIHFNDSKEPFNSKKDRHAKIGEGEIGVEALQKFLKAEQLAHIPFILETPVDDEEEYRDEIVYLKQLVNS